MGVVGRIEPFSAGPLSTLRIAGNAQEAECTADLWRPFTREVELPLLGLRRLKLLLSASRRFPASEVIRRPSQASPWAVYFCYLPDGAVSARHRFTIERLKAEGFSVLVVCAAPSVAHAEQFLECDVQALVWKALGGYDFSGYTVGLGLLAEHVSDADVFVMNDSLLGPLWPLRPLVESSPWTLTGLVSSCSVEQHIVSCAFHFKHFGPEVWRRCRSVFFRHISFNHQGPVSLLQETRLASALSRVMSVGSIVAPSTEFSKCYYVFGNPQGLLDAGFPFLKYSLFTKFSDGFDQEHYRSCLLSYGHPDVLAPS